MTIHSSLNRSGPVMTPASNPHRAGVPNHHQTSGNENPMTDTSTHPPSMAAELLGLRSWVRRAVAERINRGALDVTDSWTVPEAVTDLVTDLVAEQTSLLRARLEATVAELDAATDAVADLVGELEQRGGVVR
jgi:hypothetical protein